jgi:lactoylglutathione lyase
VPLTFQKNPASDYNSQSFFDDPDGNRIELMQMMPDCLQLEAIARLKREAVEA